jgi:uncharacterized protein (TIGR00251 family)
LIDVCEGERGASFLVRVQPRARRDEIDGEWQGAFRIRLNAPAIEGRANEALKRFLAGRLNVPVAAVRIASGQRGRLKRVEVQGAKADQVRAMASFSEAPQCKD